jgi:hypothetical protein
VGCPPSVDEKGEEIVMDYSGQGFEIQAWMTISDW